MVIMPFATEFDAVYNVIEGVCDALKLDCRRTDKNISDEHILEQIYKGIHEADIVVAELTGSNPNVMYELGYARADNKDHHFVLMAQDLSSDGQSIKESSENNSLGLDVPFDLAGYDIITYDRARPWALGERLETALKAIIEDIDQSPRALQKLFGPMVWKANNPIVYIPVFKPKSYNNLLGDNSVITKVIRRGKEVPMYSDTMVVDDYAAYEELVKLFTEQGFRALDHVPDTAPEDRWFRNSGVISIGGPRGNDVTKYILSLPACRELIVVNEPEDAINTWKLTVNLKNRSLERGSPTEKGAEPSALGIIVRAHHPENPDHVSLAVFGDRAESTLGIAAYIRREFRLLADFTERLGGGVAVPTPLVVIVGFTGHEYSEDKLLLAASHDEILAGGLDQLEQFPSPN